MKKIGFKIIIFFMIIKLNKINQKNNLILHYNTIKKGKSMAYKKKSCKEICMKKVLLLNIINF